MPKQGKSPKKKTKRNGGPIRLIIEKLENTYPELNGITDHNDPPLTILATFTVPAPISVAVRLRRVWYRSAAPIVASNGLHLSSVPKVVDLFMSPRTPRTSNWSLATLRRPLRYAKMTVASPGRTRISAARRAASAHARREFVRTKVGIRL